MAIALDTSSKKDWANTGTSFTWAHTCTGANLVLFGTSFNTSNKTMSFTYNGVSATSMTVIDQASYTGDNNYVAIGALLNPATGANNIVMSFSASCTAAGVAASYTGVRQTNFPDCTSAAGVGHNNSSVAVTDSLTTASDNCWLISSVYDVDGLTTVASGIKRNHTAALTGIDDSNGARTPAGTQTMQWTGTNFRFGGHITVAFAPAVVTPPSTPTRRRFIRH